MKEDVTNHDERQGKRYICLARQSDDSEGTTSTEAQLELLHAEGQKRGMVHVDDVVLAGVSGSMPGKRDDLAQILERKRQRDDFDVLLVQRMDRLTRSGGSHGFWVEHECEKAGIELLFADDDVPEDGPYSGLIKAAKFDMAREQARSISQRSVQGWMHAIQQGRNSVVSRTPYGCDRLYLNSEGSPLFVIRGLGDGRQQKLDPRNGETIDTYGQVGGGTKGHYRKQKEESVLIVPGERQAADTVREIFDLHYNHRWGGKRIADRLNREGVISPMGKGWSQRQVESIYENPVYCGWALGNRLSQSLYYSRGEDRPQAVKHDPKTRATCQNTPRKLRPPEDWLWQQQPLMADFLPRGLAEKALAQIQSKLEQRYQAQQDPTVPGRSTSKHKASDYILTDLLVAQQDKGALTGILCGRKGKRRRYYRHRRGKIGYQKGSVYNKLIQAEPLEHAVLDLVQQVVIDAPDFRGRIREAVEAQRPSAETTQQLAELRQQRDKVARRVQTILQTFDEPALVDAKPEMDRLGSQRQSLDQQIEELEGALQHSAEDPEALVDKALQTLTAMQGDLRGLAASTKRQLLQAFVDRVEVDMATKDAAVHLKLPSWAFNSDGEAMCLAHSSPSPTVCETHQGSVIPLLAADCAYHHDRSNRQIEYCCRRRAA